MAPILPQNEKILIRCPPAHASVFLKEIQRNVLSWIINQVRSDKYTNKWACTQTFIHRGDTMNILLILQAASVKMETAWTII